MEGSEVTACNGEEEFEDVGVFLRAVLREGPFTAEFGLPSVFTELRPGLFFLVPVAAGGNLNSPLGPGTMSD